MNTSSEEYAVYLPAVNLNYAQTLVSEIADDRPFPSEFSLGDFAFWEGKSGLWHHSYFLHSVGQYKVGASPDNAVTRRGADEGVLFGDSAGYQIGKGSLKGLTGLEADMTGLAAFDAWRSKDDVKAWIVGWLETYTNYAMTIDMPLWATLPHGEGSPFHKCSHEQLLGMTVENLRFIDRNRTGQTKWLNVIQGLDTGGMLDWWSEVKWFGCSGYSFSAESGKRNGLRAVIEPLLVMRDENAFENDRDWLHLLGCSTAPWAIVGTAIQRAIRADANPKLRVSFDSASPFQEACVRERYCKIPGFDVNRKSWSIPSSKAPQRRKHVGSDSPVPFSSPLADKLTLGDLNVRVGKFEKNRFDRFSHLFLMNHNVWVYLQTFKEANDLVFTGDRSKIPIEFGECIDIIEEAFRVENWQELLLKHAGLLDGFKG